jgi:TLD/PEP-CTERM motif
MQLRDAILRLTACAVMALPLSATTVWTGGTLLNQTNANQLATWLGEGDLSLTNVFSSGPVVAGSPFHTASDNIGRTFVLIQTSAGLLGGYNPQSWNSSGTYNVTSSVAERTAFIFNLSLSLKLAQDLSGFGLLQTFNSPGQGPAFGGGNDLGTSPLLDSIFGSSYSYGNGISVFDGLSGGSSRSARVTRVETYTIAKAIVQPPPPSQVPEPATWALCGSALALLAWRKRR